MIARRLEPLVHAEWSARWFAGDPGLAGLFGPPPRAVDLEARARSIPARPDGLSRVHWCDEPAPTDSLVVVAGQQPVLLGGPALVVHKCATAIALAHKLEARLERPVRPVFLLATQDHDSSEVDHLDVKDGSSGHLYRVRAKLAPRSEMFARAHWDPGSLDGARQHLKTICGNQESHLDHGLSSEPLAAHVEQLLTRLFAETGLGIVHAHQLPLDASRPLLERALTDTAGVRAVLAHGASHLAREGLRIPFDPDDRRPLVLQSRSGRRRRLEEGPTSEALAALATTPEDFSPHAALRPVIQAAGLPVVAQVVGPSELLYLGQARALHEWAGVPAPILVPRLEATVVEPDELDRAETLLDRARGGRGFSDPELARLAEEVERGMRALGEAVVERAPALDARVRRLDQRVARDVRRLARAPEHHLLGRDALQQRVRPRGRAQDSVLAWLPDALAAPDPRAWARQLIELARPLDPPRHVLYAHEHAHAPEQTHG